MVLIRIIIFVCMAIVATKAANTCYHSCTRDYKPVCAFNGVVFKTYANKCLFEIANCELHNTMTIISNGECQIHDKGGCNKICTMDYNPVCGSDGHKSITYGNMCSFKMANCEAKYKLHLIRNGECLKEKNKTVEEIAFNCERPCPAIYLPVCGFDGKRYETFASKCEYDVMNCLSNNHLRFIKMGECDGNTILSEMKNF